MASYFQVIYGCSLYEKQEQELNGYRDHVNELCLQQSFHGVIAYDEDYRVTALTNRNLTLFNRDTKVEGQNFDATTVNKQRLNTYWSMKLDTKWQMKKKSVSIGTDIIARIRKTAEESMLA
ncbi:41768_t:CDS:1 [Gigaspora margarita]|uniref:41768_t:CDS:1 n=1 Tax=Gigaspora margarita TaxID=4874 RepID=A0ABN7VL81_GIGMA|nr:41768_t:CDS:1 [Gigaspora margarita]